MLQNAWRNMTKEATEELELLIIPVFYLYFKPYKGSASISKSK